jgi:hypothetical protein
MLISIHVYSKAGECSVSQQRGGDWGEGNEGRGIFIWNTNGFHEFFPFVAILTPMSLSTSTKTNSQKPMTWLDAQPCAVWHIYFGVNLLFFAVKILYRCAGISNIRVWVRETPVSCCQLYNLPCSAICNAAGPFWAGSSPRPLLLQSAPSKANSDVRWVPDDDPYAHTK